VSNFQGSLIRRYIQQHRLEKTGDTQLSLFE